jgi:hypothetical protein
MLALLVVFSRQLFAFVLLPPVQVRADATAATLFYTGP